MRSLTRVSSYKEWIFYRILTLEWRILYAMSSVGELVNELLDDMSFPVLEEAREVMFKQSTLRYINLLDTEMEYSELDEVPILMLKNRRKGDLQKQKTAKDLVNMVIYSSALCDIFPKDTLSCNTTKFIDLENKVTDTEKSRPEVSSKEVLDTSVLSNRVRDQELQIEGLKRELLNTRTELLAKLEGMEILLRLILSKQAIAMSNSSLVYVDQAN